jgi:hypothetical protein
MGTGAKLRKFQADKDLELFAVSPADAAAEAVSNRDNQIYFGKGAISLREGEPIESIAQPPTSSTNFTPAKTAPTCILPGPLNSSTHALF